jgi:vacuolar-type H+-ATPase subunit I/STV1
MALPDPLKKAIVQMSSREKDKLLLRLVAKDSLLVDRLHFELIEDSNTLPERREAIRERILKIAQMSQFSPGWIMMDMRSLSGDITHHVKITKDKYGEIELNVHLLNVFFENHAEQLRNYSSRSDKCALYIAKKTETVLRLLAKLDEDYYVDFVDAVNQLLHSVHTMCPHPYARQLQLPQEWP